MLEQAVPNEVSEELRCRMEGPTDAGDAGVAHERAVEVDGVPVEPDSDNECASHAAIPDPKPSIRSHARHARMRGRADKR